MQTNTLGAVRSVREAARRTGVGRGARTLLGPAAGA